VSRIAWLTCSLSLTAPLLLVTAARAQGGEVTPPQLLEHSEVPYPPAQVATGKDTTVVLVVVVERDGSVSDAKVAASGGPPFDEAALAAVYSWRFSPASREGAPARARIKVPVRFAQQGSSAPAAPPPIAPSASTTAAPKPARERAASAPPVGASDAAKGEAPSTPAASEDTAKEKEPIEVTILGRAKPPSRGASDFNLRVGELSHVPRKNAAEMLTLAPGILLTNDGGEGHAEQVFLRGFDAREGQDIEFTVGGVPINESGNLHGNGYADTHFVMPELVESLRVVEGPFDPRQGNYAVAGSADYELGLEQRGLSARYTVGSFDTHRAVLLWGPPGTTTHTFGGAELYTTDGFGQNRDAKRATAMGQYEGPLGATGTFRLTGTAYVSSYHSAGVLREDDFSRGQKRFYDTYDPLQGGDSSCYSAAADIELRSGDMLYKQQVFAIYRGMRLRENFTGFLLDVQTPLQTPHGQRGDLLDLDVTSATVGARGSARLSSKVLGQTQELELGYFARGDDFDGTQARIETATGHPYHLDTSLTGKLGDVGLYADAGLRPLSWLTLRGGVRADLFAYDVLDRCAVDSIAHPSRANPPGDASCLDQQDFGRYREPFQRTSVASAAVMPRGSVIVGPVRRFYFSASAGRGVRSVDPTYITQDAAATPFARITALEGGVSFVGAVRDVEVTARSIVFQTSVDQDLVFSETAGRNTLAKDGTTRTGWVGSVRLTGEHFDVSSNVTLVRSIFNDTHLLVPYVPGAVVRADAAAFTSAPFKLRGSAPRGALSAGLTYVGPRPLPYGQRGDAITTLDASATVAWTHYEIGLSVTNLLNQQYRLGEYNFASDFHTEPSPTLVPVRHFTAGAPRAVYGTFGVNFGGT
jgi:iron complex outermembrane recepter protein